MRAPIVTRMIAAIAAAVTLALGAGACGGSEESATALLDKAFREPIESADVALDMTFQAKGVKQLEQPIRFQLRGPYKSGGKERIPTLDLDMSLAFQGQTFTAGLISTGDNAWISFRGENYEVGRDAVTRVNRQIAEAGGGQDRTLKDFGIDPRRWLEEPKEEGEEEVAGTNTTHVSTGLDVARMLADLNNIGDRAAGRLGGQPAPKLTDEQRRSIEEIVKDPKLDVYVGKDDNKIRRLSTELKLEVPEDQRAQAGGAESGSVSFSIEFANVGGDQKATAPSSARPLQDLAEQLQGLFGNQLGGGSGSGSSGSGSGSSGSGGASSDKVDRVRDCLREAGQDQAAQERCAALL